MTLEQIRDQGLIVYEAICGSKAYGTNDENSDTDLIGVYILPQSKLLGGKVDVNFDSYGNEFIPNVSSIRIHDKESKTDAQYFELRHYLKLLAQGSPQAIESLFLPENCVLSCDDNFKKLVLDKRHAFITDKLKYSFVSGPMRVLQEQAMLRALLDRDYLHFYRLLPNEIHPAQSWYQYTSRFAHEKIIPTDYILEAVENCTNIYSLYVSHRHQAMRTHDKDLDLPPYSGLAVDDAGNPITYKRKIASPQEVSYPLSFVRNIYFDKPAYLKYMELKKKQRKIGVTPGCDMHLTYDGKTLAHCYRLLLFAVNIACTHEIKLDFPSKFTYQEIRENRMPFYIVRNVLESLETNALKQFAKETVGYNSVSLETLGELELTLRSRMELTRALNKETILTSQRDVSVAET